jgi:hypothetical protein
VTFRYRPRRPAGRSPAPAGRGAQRQGVHHLDPARRLFTLRLAVLNRTHLSTIDYLLDLLQRKASELNAGR